MPEAISGSKQSQANLIRLLENAIQHVGDLSSETFYVMVRDVIVKDSSPARITAYVLVRFLPDGAPFCCGEPSCYSPAFRATGEEEIGEYLRRKMNLEETPSVELRIKAEYFEGITFTAHASE